MRLKIFFTGSLLAALAGCGSEIDPFAYQAYPLSVRSITVPERGKVGEPVPIEVVASSSGGCSGTKEAIVALDDGKREVSVRAEGRRRISVCTALVTEYTLATTFTPRQPGVYRILPASGPASVTAVVVE